MTVPDVADGSDGAELVPAPASDRPGQGEPGPGGPGPGGGPRPGLGDTGGFAGLEAGWRRLSRRSMVVRPLTDLARLLPLLAGLLLLHSRTGGGLAWGVAAAVFAVVTG
ncbi:MAG TPA: hypothetical protein VEM58_09405, partial [Streptosporangiaceae bacterium]|nr:hypothetical protein [Streptosporangiaceae bacterium]